MKKIAIIDDDQQSRATLQMLIEDAGYDVEPITGKFGNDKESLINKIKERNVFGVISDHRLSHGQLANFYGSDLLSSLYDLNIPSILITQFLDLDADTSIRKFRDKLPVVIGRGNHKPELINDLFEFSQKELVEGRGPSRKPHRALIRVDHYNHGDLVEGVVTNWDVASTIKFPSDLIPKDIQRQMHESGVNRLIAFVNTGASNQQDIFITDIHIAPRIEDLDEFS